MLAVGMTSRNISCRNILNCRKRSILTTIVRAIAATAAATTSGVSCGTLLLTQNHSYPTTALSLRTNSPISAFGVGRLNPPATTSVAESTTNRERSRRMFSQTSSVGGSSDHPLEVICLATLQACAAVTPAIEALYRSINDETSKTKADESVFTIADGLVQFLLAEILLGHQVVGDIVGEEDCDVNLLKKPYTVDDLNVPAEFEDVIEEAIRGVKKARDGLILDSRYQSLTAFIDPIDGTREFSTQKGEQCSVCVGFADIETGKPVAGVVYRPLSRPNPTWAAGAKDEAYSSSSLSPIGKSTSTQAAKKGMLLTTNGRISPFLDSVMKELDYERVPSGGAGNKMLMLLEGTGTAYIQDRGVSRWDTCGAQAVLEAHGGVLCKLDQFLEKNLAAGKDDEMSYTYRKTDQNLDFVPSMARLTKYNAAAGIDQEQIKSTNGDRMAVTPSEVKPYANLCGLVALAKYNSDEESKEKILNGLRKAAKVSPPAFD